MTGEELVKSSSEIVRPGGVDSADRPALLVDDDPSGVEEVDPGMLPKRVCQDLDGARCPEIVPQKDGHELAARLAHAGIEGACQLPALVVEHPDARIIEARCERMLHALAHRPLDDDEELPASRGLAEHGLDGLSQEERLVRVHGHADTDVSAAHAPTSRRIALTLTS